MFYFRVAKIPKKKIDLQKLDTKEKIICSSIVNKRNLDFGTCTFSLIGKNISF